MGIFGMLTTGASGMNAQANRLGAISDNIANAETTGYKTAGAQFSSLLLPSGLSQYNSGSVNTTITHAISMQGPLLDAALVTDLAVQGPGFYLVNATPSTVSANPTVMTRAGDFVQDGNGFLVNAAGFGLMGFNSDASGNPVGAITAANLVPIQIPSAGLVANPTTGGTLTVNLNSDATTGDAFPVIMTAFDLLGSQVDVPITMTKDATTLQWNMSTTAPVFLTPPDPLVFNADGSLSTPANQVNNSPPPATYTYQINGVPGGNDPIYLDMSASTQLSLGVDGPVGTTLQNTLNGGAPSEFDHLAISDTGVVSLVYSNGASIPKFVIPLANVTGVDNLAALPGNVFATTNNSGPMQIGLAKSAGFGVIKSTSLEQSNVDIATELAALIETQRIFEANSKVFETGSTLTATLVNLVR